jgi:hypothetical protein
MAYLEEMEAKLQAARTRVKQGREVKHLKDGAPTLFEIMDSEISIAVTKMTGSVPLTYEEYLSQHGRVMGIKSIRDLLNFKQAEEAQSVQEVEAIEGQLNQFKNDQVQQ